MDAVNLQGVWTNYPGSAVGIPTSSGASYPWGIENLNRTRQHIEHVIKTRGREEATRLAMEEDDEDALIYILALDDTFDLT